MRQLTYSGSLCRFGRSKVNALLITGLGVLTLPNADLSHPLATASLLPAKTQPMNLSVSELEAEKLKAIEALDESQFHQDQQGIVKLAKFAAKQLRERKKDVQKTRLISRLASFVTNLADNPEKPATVAQYVEKTDLEKKPKGRDATERFWYGLQAMKTMMGWQNTPVTTSQAEGMGQVFEYVKSDLTGMTNNPKLTSIAIDVQVDARAMMEGSLTQSEKEWVNQTENLLEEAVQVSVPEQFPIDLPDSQFAGEGNIISREDTFQAPVFETEREIAYENGKRIYLKDRPELLKDLTENARIVIPSIKHEGKFHEFKVRFLVNGTQKIKAVFEKGVTLASNQITLQIPRRFFSDKISYRNAIVNLGHALYESLDLLVGVSNKVPAYSASEIESRVATAKAKQFASFLTPVGGTEKDPSFVFQTKDQNPITIDLRLQKPGLSSKVSVAVGAALSSLEDELKKSRVTFLQETENSLRNSHPDWDTDHILAATEKAWDMLLRERAIEALQSDATLQELDVVSLVVDQFRSTFAFNDLNAKLQLEKDLKTKEVEEEIRSKFKRKSKNPKFFNEQKTKRLAAEFEVLEDQFMDDLINDLGAEGLTQHQWVMQQNIAFVEKAQRLREKLANEKKSAKIHEFDVLRLPQFFESENIGDEENPHYVAKIKDTFKVDTSKPFWRFKAMGLRLASVFSSGNFFVAVQNFLNGPVGVRSLFGRQDTYQVKAGVDETTGEWQYEDRMTLKGRYGRVLKWRKNMLKRFEESDENGLLSKDVARPFVQFYGGLGVVGGTVIYPVGQTAATIVNAGVTTLGVGTSIAWSPIVAVGGYATDAMLFDRLSPTPDSYGGDYYGRRVGTELLESAVIGLGSYFYGPAVAMAGFTAFPIVNDQINQNMSNDHQAIKKSPVFPLPYQAAVTFGQGVVGQATAATAGVFGAHLATAGVTVGASGLTSGVMKGWDSLWFNTILKPHARIPDTADEFFTQKVQGPGLASEYLYQIPNELAVSGVFAWMENRRLINFKDSKFKTLAEYESNLDAYTSKILTTVPGSSSLPGAEQAKQQIEEGVEEYRTELVDSIDHRRSQTKDVLDLDVKGLIKLSQSDLDRAIRLSTLLLRQKGEEYLLSGLSESEIVEFWDQKDLTQNDWQGLARHVLASIFGNGILTPMEEADPDFRIEVDNRWETFLDRLDDGRIFQDQESLYIQLINRYRAGLPGFEELMTGALRNAKEMDIDGSMISSEFTNDSE